MSRIRTARRVAGQAGNLGKNGCGVAYRTVICARADAGIKVFRYDQAAAGNKGLIEKTMGVLAQHDISIPGKVCELKEIEWERGSRVVLDFDLLRNIGGPASGSLADQ